MKIKTISRSESEATRDSRREVVKVHKNSNPTLHPFEKAREVRIRTLVDFQYSSLLDGCTILFH